MIPIDEAWADDTETLASQFETYFPDGIALDMEKPGRRQMLAGLDQTLLVGILPMAVKSLTEGTLLTSVSGRWVTPVFHRGKLRLIFILPPECDRDRLRQWRRAVNTWHAGGRGAEVSHARSG